MALVRVVVRSKRDADAVRAALERFYRGWDVEVHTLHGRRSAEDMLEHVPKDPWYTIILLGREDEREAKRLQELLPPTHVVHVVPRSRVRNARLEMIAWEILRARARLRATVWWGWEHKSYIFSVRGDGQLLLDPDVEADAMLVLERGVERLSKLLGCELKPVPLMARVHGSLHCVWCGPHLVGELEIVDHGLAPSARRLEGSCPHEVPLTRVIEANQHVLKAFEDASIAYLRSLGDFDIVVVPWSGGKDSTACLVLALKAFGARRVVAVYTDTGVDFPETRTYIEKVSRSLGVKVYTAYAPVDRELPRRGLPSHEERWCTQLKVEATERAIRELAEGRQVLVVVGDRDAESPARAWRPPTRREELVYASPIRLWGAVHVQLYLQANGVPLHSLYLEGFYRLGCYVCPALRSWENYILATSRTGLRLLGSRWYRERMWRSIYRRPAC